MKKKLKSTDQEVGKQTQLEDRIEGLNTEIKMLQNQKQEKDQKLKGQIRKNEELLGELQELSEAVHALKNDKSFSASAQILEEREEVIQHYHHYLSNNQKRSLDRVFSTILKAVE